MEDTKILQEGIGAAGGLIEGLSDTPSHFLPTTSNRYISALSKGYTCEAGGEEDMGDESINVHFPELVIRYGIAFQETFKKILARPAFAQALAIFSAAHISSDGLATVKISDYIRLRGIGKSLAYKEINDAGAFFAHSVFSYKVESIPQKELEYYQKHGIRAFDYSHGRQTIYGGIRIIKRIEISQADIKIEFDDDYVGLAKAFSKIIINKELLAIDNKKHPAACWIGLFLENKLNQNRKKKDKEIPSHLNFPVETLLKAAGSGIQAEKDIKNWTHKARIVKKLEQELDALPFMGGWNYTGKNGQKITREEADKMSFKMWKALRIDFTFKPEIIEEIKGKNDKN